jgi:hypothetical protein
MCPVFSSLFQHFLDPLSDFTQSALAHNLDLAQGDTMFVPFPRVKHQILLTWLHNVVTLVLMEFEWDEAKRKSNLRNHGLDFVGIEQVFEGETVSILDDRFDYGE